MTRSETKKILAVIKAAYPNFHKDSRGAEKSDAEWSAVIDIWAIALAEFPYGFIANGFKALVQTNKFPPSPAEVIDAAKSSAIDRMQVYKYRPLGQDYRELNTAIPPDTWMWVSGRAVQFGDWAKEQAQLGQGDACRQLGEGKDTQT